MDQLFNPVSQLRLELGRTKHSRMAPVAGNSRKDGQQTDHFAITCPQVRNGQLEFLKGSGMPQIRRLSVGRPRRFVPPEQIRELRRKGLSFRQIARTTGFGYGSVRRAFQMAVASGGSGEDLGHNSLQTADAAIPGGGLRGSASVNY